MIKKPFFQTGRTTFLLKRRTDRSVIRIASLIPTDDGGKDIGDDSADQRNDRDGEHPRFGRIGSEPDQKEQNGRDAQKKPNHLKKRFPNEHMTAGRSCILTESCLIDIVFHTGHLSGCRKTARLITNVYIIEYSFLSVNPKFDSGT